MLCDLLVHEEPFQTLVMIFVQNGRLQVIAFQSLDLAQASASDERMQPGYLTPSLWPWLPAFSGLISKRRSYEQVNVSLTVVPPDIDGPNTLIKLVELQEIISQEDRASYSAAIAPPPG